MVDIVNIKRVFDRSISTSILFFTYRKGMIHHRRRYKNQFVFRVFMYGDITDKEKDVAEGMVKAHKNNNGSQEASVTFVLDPEEIGALI